MNVKILGKVKDKMKHQGFQKYLKNTSWMFLGRIFSLVVSFFVGVYTAKGLGVEDFGTLNFIISFVGIAGTTLFVIDSVILKKLNEEEQNYNAILGSAFVIKLINAVFSILAATTISFMLANSNVTTTLVFIFSTYTVFQSINAIDLCFKAKADVKETTVASMTTNIITALIKVLIISLKLPVFYLLLSYVFDTFLSAVSYVILYQRNFGNIFDWIINVPMIKDIIRKSWPFTVSTLAMTIYLSVDQIFLKFFLGSKAVGLYVIAVRFSEVWFFISSVICMSLLPAIMNAQKSDYRLFISRSKKLYSLLFYLSLVISAFVFLIAPVIIHTLYGPSYEGSIILLRIYIWSIIGFFIGTALQQFLLAQNKFKTILVFNLLGMVLSLVLNPIFIHNFGVKGAAIANIFTYTLPVIILLSSSRMKDQRNSVVSAIFKPF